MRVRYKPYARPELAAFARFANAPESLCGNWKSFFKNPAAPLHIELGCGKGAFIAAAACNRPGCNFLGIDIKSEMLVEAKRKIEDVCGPQAENVALTAFDVARLHLILAPEDKPERIYINFPNPWPKNQHKKRRLTHTRQLLQYRSILAQNGEIYFKTDDKPLFCESLAYFAEAGFEIACEIKGLKEAPGLQPELLVQTEHETMFRKKGMEIYAVIAKKK